MIQTIIKAHAEI